MKKAKKTLAKSSKRTTTYPRIASDTFVTQKMLYSVRDELIAHTEKKFHEFKSDIHGIKSEIEEIRSDLHEVKSHIAKLDKSIHKMSLLVEEQNNRNKIVLDGLSQLFERQDRIEKKVDSSF